MKPQLFCNQISVRPSSVHGYGVFADKNIRIGEIVEECYLLVTAGGDNVLKNYYFDADGNHSLFLGLGCIYNHAEKNNATYDIDMNNSVATIYAVEPINKGEEIFISYGKHWFPTRNWKPKRASVWRRLLHPKYSVFMRGLIACVIVMSVVHFLTV